MNAEMRFWHKGGDVIKKVVEEFVQSPSPSQPIMQTVMQPVIQPVQQSQPVIITRIEEKKEEIIRSPNAEAVAKWLQEMGVGQYVEVFLKNGFDRMDAVYKIEEKDLVAMNIALGHIKTIMAATGNAQYIGKSVVLRSAHGYFLAAEKLSGKEGKFDHHDKRDGAAFFNVKDLGENKIGLEVKQYGTYMHLPPPDGGLHVRHGPMDKTNCELTFIPIKPGFVAIKCVTNACFLALEEKKLIGRSIVTAYEQGRDTTVEIFVLEN